MVFGPQPRDYTTDMPRKVRQLARRSALNARARESGLHVVERFSFDAPKTRELAGLLGKLGVEGRKVLVLLIGVQAAFASLPLAILPLLRSPPRFSCGARSAFKPKERKYLRSMLSCRQLHRLFGTAVAGTLTAYTFYVAEKVTSFPFQPIPPPFASTMS